MLTTRRSLITGLAGFLAAPAIVRAASLMPVKAIAARYSDEIVIPELAWRFAAQRVQLAPGSLNFAEPYPGWRFRFTDGGLMIHEPDPEAANAA